MWLPTPVYESLPYAYVVVGILFISGATYIGLGTGQSGIYLGVGSISVLGGVLVFVRRMIARSNKNGNGPGAGHNGETGGRTT